VFPLRTLARSSSLGLAILKLKAEVSCNSNPNRKVSEVASKKPLGLVNRERLGPIPTPAANSNCYRRTDPPGPKTDTNFLTP